MSGESPLLRTVLIEDNPVLLDLLRGMLGGIDGVEVVGHAASATEALSLLRQVHPRLAVVDLELAGSTGLDVLAALQQSPGLYGAPIPVVFSNHAHPIVQSRCLALGARAFFDKSFHMDDLLDFVHAAARSG